MGNTAMQEVATVLVAHSGMGTRGLLALARRIRARRDVRQGRRRSPRRCPTKGPTPQLAPRSSSFAG